MNRVETSNDLCLHARYWYYVKHSPVVSDAVYDIYEANLKLYLQEYPEYDRPGLECYKVGSDKEEDYPKWVKTTKPKWPKR